MATEGWLATSFCRQLLADFGLELADVASEPATGTGSGGVGREGNDEEVTLSSGGEGVEQERDLDELLKVSARGWKGVWGVFAVQCTDELLQCCFSLFGRMRQLKSVQWPSIGAPNTRLCEEVHGSDVTI